MAHSKPSVLLFQDDFERMKDWVLQYPDRETGGQLFGLWTHSKNPYINIVIGPGRECRHETHSFHQDIDYLKNVGTFLNKEFMMCHIGEWHSHHRLRLRQPSSGDLNSIWNHFPSGVEHFLLVIATIESDRVKIWPYLFTASSRTHEFIDTKIIQKDNVFMSDEDVRTSIANGAEVRKVKPSRAVCSSTRQDTLWFHSEMGSSFVQHLNSDLEILVDNESEIAKTLDSKGLEFSFQHHKIRWVLLFPPDFLRHGVSMKRANDKFLVRQSNHEHAKTSPYDGLVEKLVKTLQQNCLGCQKGNKPSFTSYVLITKV